MMKKLIGTARWSLGAIGRWLASAPAASPELPPASASRRTIKARYFY